MAASQAGGHLANLIALASPSLGVLPPQWAFESIGRGRPGTDESSRAADREGQAPREDQPPSDAMT